MSKMREKLISLRGNRTQEKVANDIGISQKHLSAIETGYRNPSINTMKKLEKYYGVSMIELFPDIFLDKNTTKRGSNEYQTAQCLN